MSRVVNADITAALDATGSPRSFSWRCHSYQISEIWEEWCDTGCWWDGETEKRFYQVHTADNGVYEIYYDLGRATWHLYRVID